MSSRRENRIAKAATLPHTLVRMPALTLRPSHKAVAAYYESLEAFATLGEEHEQAVRSAFATLLEAAARPFGWKLVPEHSMKGKGGRRISPDGTLMDVFRLQHGHWEAKDSQDNLNKESVEHVLREHFDTSLSDKGVHIFDPFVSEMKASPASSGASR